MNVCTPSNSLILSLFRRIRRNVCISYRKDETTTVNAIKTRRR
jgi:hypothetical protein